MHPAEHVEIERKFLLHRAPPIPGNAEVWRIEQGYLARTEPRDETSALGAAGQLTCGRLRRVSYPDRSVKYFHTIKTGVGIERIEHEREMSREEFELDWPRTIDRRLSKTRHRVREGALVWEIDVLDGIDLVLAEIELPSANAAFEIPAWLKPHILHEVTNDPQYTNASIAKRLVEQARGT